MVPAKLHDEPARAAPLLLAWYDAHARRLPWRETRDPYRIWLSEVMLQQTTVATVRSRFADFVARWPTVAALAAADDAAVMAAWAGLGYYARARNLLACARAVVTDHDGAFPSDEAQLRALPGVGDYTAAAIAAIAFDRPAVVIDGNVERVVARLLALDEPLPGGKRAIRAAARAITPRDRPGDFAQAMMDLGATICTPRAPGCAACPLADVCAGKASGTPAAFPAKLGKPERPQRYGTAFWIERRGRVLLVRRPPRGLLGGMRALPTGPWMAAPPGLADAPLATLRWTLRPDRVRHLFTHFRLELALAVARAGGQADAAQGEWWPIDALESAGLPTLFAKVARLRRE